MDNMLLYARILHHKGNSRQALVLADDILLNTRKHEIKLKLIEAALFKISILLKHSGGKREILNLYKEAVFYAWKDSILLSFFFERETVVLSLEKQYHEDLIPALSPEERLFLRMVLQLCRKEDPDLLSKRELDVLRELAAGCSNKEIAGHLNISLATVKSHIINIYGKLQVNSRVGALEAARKSGLI